MNLVCGGARQYLSTEILASANSQRSDEKAVLTRSQVDLRQITHSRCTEGTAKTDYQIDTIGCDIGDKIELCVLKADETLD